jgi:hypothetical protein
MYTDEVIYKMVVSILEDHVFFFSVKHFLQEFHKKYPYPSTSTLYKKFGSIANLMFKAGEWGKEQRRGKT